MVDGFYFQTNLHLLLVNLGFGATAVEWCEKIFRALEDSVDSVSQEVFDHKKTWGETSIPSRLSQRQSLEQTEARHKEAMTFLQSLRLQTVLVNPPQSKKVSP